VILQPIGEGKPRLVEKLVYVTDIRCQSSHYFQIRGEVTSLSESSQGEVGDNREKWGDFWEKLIAIK
jgi:hypothetical protein